MPNPIVNHSRDGPIAQPTISLALLDQVGGMPGLPGAWPGSFGSIGVADLDAWLAKLRGEAVTILDGPYRLGDTRAVMIGGPSREAIALVEVN